MDDVKAVRLRNLRRLIDEHADRGINKKEFAALVGTAAAYISQILSPNHPAQIGDVFSRQVESRLKLPNGWMDHDHEAQRAVGEFRRVPLLDMTRMTTWRAAVQNKDAQMLEVAIPAAYPQSVHAYRITGTAMAPDYPPGCAVIVNPDMTPRPGDCVIASLGDGRVVFRRYDEEAGAAYLSAIDPRQPIIRRADVVEMLVATEVVHSLRR